MQVSQIANLDTHAIIGGGKAQAFGMSDSAEFFTVLSDTLYRDKKRAVVREVICNAWDAHLMVGKTNVPVEITLTDEELIIKDFGPGISEDRIVPIYCVYGASTKVGDANQTGGFGLGSKAPFAYADHFTVTSCFEGIKTVYAISRGGVETDGKPDIRAMVRVATQETGITVTVPLRSKDDRGDFSNHIQRVVKQGGMFARLNEKTLPRINYDKAREKGFVVVETHLSGLSREIQVLYGTVLYPVTSTDDEVTAAATRLLKMLPNSATIVLIAKPNSLGVTPSRESLSFTDKTKETVLRLIRRATHAHLQVEGRALATLADGVVKNRYGDIHRITLYRSGGSGTWTGTDPLTVAMARLSYAIEYSGYRNESDVDSLSERWLKARMEAAKRKFPEDRRIFRRHKAMAKFRRTLGARRSGRLIFRLAAKTGLLKNLRVFSDNGITGGTLGYVKARMNDVFSSTLIIGTTTQEISAYCKGKRSTSQATLCLVVPKKTPQHVREEIRRLAAGYKLTLDEIEQFELPKRVVKPKVVEKILYHLLTDTIETAPQLEDPQFYVRGRRMEGNIYLRGYMRDVASILLHHFPKTAIVFTGEDEDRLKAAGAKELVGVMHERLASMVADRSFQYLFAGKAYGFVRGNEYRAKTASLIKSLVSADMRLAQLLFPAPRIKVAAEHREAHSLFCAMNAINWSEFPKEQAELHDKVWKDLEVRSKATWKALFVTVDNVDAKFAYLTSLVGVEPLTADKDDLVEIVRFLKRRNSKSPMTENRLKEAA